MFSNLLAPLAPMVFFSLATSISPGPVNFVALSLGTQRSVSHALPFVTGATVGFTLLLALLGLGLEQTLGRYPSLLLGLSAIGSAFIAYMGFKILHSSLDMHVQRSEPMGFMQGFLLQWLNPKAWVSCLAGHAAFQTTNAPQLLALFTATYLIVCFVGVGSWAVAGGQIAQLLKNPNTMQRFNRLMGGALIAIAVFLAIQPYL